MTTAITVQTTGIEAGEWATLRDQAAEALKSGFLPRAIQTPAQAMAIVMTGRELGLPPMASLRSIHIVEGKPTMSADLMAGLALSRLPGATFRVLSTTDAECVVLAGRPGQEPTEFRWTIEDARRANLTGKGPWKSYPRAMLRARVTSEACRATFPDVLAGVYLPEELEAPFDRSEPVQRRPEQLPERSTEQAADFGDIVGAIRTAATIEALEAIGRGIKPGAFSPDETRQLRASFRQRRAHLSQPVDHDAAERAAIQEES